MLDWIGRLLAAPEKQETSGKDVARSSRSPSPTASPTRSTHSQRPQSRTSRFSAKTDCSSPRTSVESRRPSPLRIKREFAEPSLVFDSSSSPDRNASPSSSMSTRAFNYEETMPSVQESDHSSPSRGFTVPGFVPDSPTRGLMYDQKRGLHLMTKEEEYSISQRELAKLQRLKALREKLLLAGSDSDEEEEEEEEERVQRSTRPSNRHLPVRRQRSRTLKEKHPHRVAKPAATTIRKRPYALPPVPTTRVQGSSTHANNSSTRRYKPTIEMSPSTPSSDPFLVTPADTTTAPSASDATQDNDTLSTRVVPPPVASSSSRTLSRADTWPALKPSVESIKFANLPQPQPKLEPEEGKVSSTVQKIAEAKMRATMRIMGHPSSYTTETQRRLLTTGRTRLKSQFSKAEMEQKNLKHLQRLMDEQKAVEARQAAEEETRRKAVEAIEAAEAEAARQVERELQWRQFAAQSEWSGKLMERFEQEQEKAESIHVYRGSLLAEFWMYEERWKALGKQAAEGEQQALLGLNDMPWPVLQSDAHGMTGPLDITADSVFFFIVHPLREESCLPAYSVRHRLLSEEAKRWNSEEFKKVIVERVVEGDRAMVLQGVEHICGLLRAIIEWEESLGDWSHDWIAKFPSL
ncbi:hypothetical protein BDY19DRAFT_951022 [Irpex rosettiformis]|uniref:Uncharacterized protein n=1 Tax=Irpex rosettiformis TaxID=378272 RepID=A0ACB8U2J9_9APHY|nr:hypothetical protein BDY19DRAFT_951022 [Irpex rosettiformis]